MSLPAYGARRVSEDGIDCHICGRTFHALGSHVYQAHGQLISDYRKEFGLSRKGLVSNQLLAKMRDAAEKVRLAELGEPTRVTEQSPTRSMSAEGRKTANANLVPAGGLKRAHQARRSMTHCKHGHEYTPENTYRDPKYGYRKCRTCIRDEWLRRQPKRNAS